MSISIAQLLTNDIYAKQHIDSFMKNSNLIKMELSSIFSAGIDNNWYTRSGLIKKYLRTDFHYHNTYWKTDFMEHFGLKVAFDYMSPRYIASAYSQELGTNYFRMSNTLYTIPPRVVAAILLITNSEIPRAFRQYCKVDGQRASKAGLFMSELKELTRTNVES